MLTLEETIFLSQNVYGSILYERTYYRILFKQKHFYTNLFSLVSRVKPKYYQKSSSLEEYCPLSLLSLSGKTFVVVVVAVVVVVIGSKLASDLG